MTTHKFIAVAAFILTLALPGSLLAGSTGGLDWYAPESAATTATVERVTPLDTADTGSIIGLDWYDVGEGIYVKNSMDDRSLAPETLSGVGMDWHTEQGLVPLGSKGDCLSLAANVNTGVNSC